MKRLLPAMLTLMGAYTASAQVGIGTENPNPSAQLEVVSQDKGVLIPRVELTSTTDATTITNGNVQSLLVYNITTNANIKPGYYYWYINRWHRLINDSDLGPGVQPIVDNGNGTYTYTNPDGTLTVIDVPGNQTVTTLVYNQTANTLTYTDENGANTVINLVDLVKRAETVTTLVDNGNGTMTYTNEAGVATIINVPQGAQGVGIATTVNNGDGTFTINYTNGTSFTTPNFTGAQGPSGANGVDGLSAYQIWLNAGNTGTQAQFLASLQGAQGPAGAAGAQGPAGAAGPQGPAGANGTNGVDGLSAYQVWLNAGNTGTQAQFLASLQGAQGPAGANGTNGVDGLSAYQVWVNAGNTGTVADFIASLKGATGATGAAGTNGADGLSAYQVWLNAGNTGTQAQFLASLQGAQGAAGANGTNGVDGLSAYQVWVNAGNTGTVADFIASLKGATGATGPQGPAGADGQDGQDGVGGVSNAGSGIVITGAGTTASPYVIAADKKDLTAGDGSVVVANGVGAVLENANVKVADSGISTAKLANGAVTADKLGATAADANKVATVNADGTVSYKTVAAGNVSYNDTTTSFGNGVDTVQEAIEALAAGTADQLGNFKLVDNNNGTISLMGADGTTPLSTINKSDITYDVATGRYTFTNGDGSNVVFGGENLSAGDGSIEVSGGTGALLLASAVKVKDGGITEAKLANNAVTTDKINTGAVTASKLSADATDVNKVATVNADGTVTYKTVDVSNLGNAKDLTAGDGSIVVTDGEGATLVDANVKVADGGIVEAKLANNAVTADKINTGAVTEAKIGTGAVTSAKIENGTIVAEDIATKTIGADKLVADGVNDVNKVATVNADGTVSYKTVDASTIGNGADLTAGDGSIVVTDGEGATLVDANVKVADGGITEAKLANNAVTTDKINTGAVTEAKIGTGAVTSAKIENGTIVAEDIATKTIGADKLVADGVNDVNKVATVNADGTVTYKTVDVSNLGNAKDLIAGDGSIVVTDGEGATLVNANVKVADGGIVEAKLANNAVTTDKINTGAVTEAKIGTGAVTENKIGTGAVTSAKIADGTIVAEDIATKTIGADKLVADGVNDVNKVATVNADGTVTYKTVDVSNLGNAKDLTAGDGSIVVTDGEGATLVDANVKVADGGIVEAKLANNAVTADKINTGAVTEAKIGTGAVTETKIGTGAVTSAKIENGTIVAEDIATKTIGADKLVADGVNDVNKVATVNADGTVSYKTVDVSNLGNAKDLTAGDGSIVVTDGEGATLVDANVKVADGGITEAKLANNAVTTDKINTGAVTSAKILDGTIVADDLATGAVTSAKIADGTIVAEDIAAKTIGADKLVADGVNDVNKVATVNADGTVTYKTVDVSNLGNAKDLTAGDGSIVVTDGEGATLVDANVKVADGGITEAKLANNAVTTDKINTGAVTEAKIGTGAVTEAKIGTGAVTSAKIENGTIVAEDIATKTIGADKLVADGVNDVNKVATVNADGTVTYKTVDASAIGNGADLTAGDGSIVVTDGEGATLVDANVKVADGGIVEAKLANNAVTTDKINIGAVTEAKIGAGAVTENKIGTGAVTSAKIADGTIVAEDIATKTIGADKLVADGVNDVNKVATVNADGTISYKTIDASTIGNGADLTAGDGSIVVTDGEGATLVDANVKVADGGIVEAKLANNAVTADKINTGAVTEAKIGTGAVTSAKIENGTIVSEDIATKTIGADKLVADGVNDVNKVATVNADGTVTYKTVDVSNLGNAKDLTAGDGSIVVTDGEGATLVDANVKVADSGITEAKLANNAVTTDKINTGAVTEAKIGTGAVTSTKILDGTIIADDLATGAVTSAKIENGTIVAEDIATKTIGADKLVADGVNDVNKVATVNADGTVTYKTVDVSNLGNAKDLTAGDGSIVVTDGEGATLVDANVKVADGGIIEAKLANNAVTTDKINTGAVTSAKILDGTIVADDLATGAVTSAKIDNGTIVAEDIATKTIGADKLVADGVNDVNKVATVNADGTVTYKTVDVSNLGNAKDLTAGDGSIVVTDGEGATLVDANVKVADGGITEAKLANNAVTADKINTGAVTEAKIGTGAVTENKIGTGAVTSAKIADGTIVAEDIAAKTIGADKLVADGVNDVNKVATVNADGTVTYKTVDVSNLGNAKDLTAGDGSIVVTDGEGATLVDANVKVADGGITEAKLANNAVTADKINTGAVTEAKIGTGAVTSAKIENGTIVAEDIATKTIGADKLVADGVNDVNKVATVNADGTVTYKTVDVSNLGNAKDLTAGDGSIVVTDGEGATLVDANVKVADGGIVEAKLANNAVTSDKINTGAVTETKIGTGAVTSAKILDGTILADDLATGAVTSAKIDNGTIVAEDIATKTIGADKLVADGVNDVNKVATVNADGTVTYKTVDVSNLGNAKDLTAGDGSIVVTDGEGATLVDANVKVADGGIIEAKLANNAITTDKINTGAVTETKIGTGAVTSAKIENGTIVAEDIATKTIGADKLVADGVNDVNKVATVNADGTVSYKTVDVSNLGNAKDLTAGDGSIVVTDGEGATLVDANVKVADGGITEAKLANNAVTADKINTGAVTEAKIGTGAVTETKIGTGAITSTKILDGTIVAEDIAAKTIGADKLVADGVNDVNKVATVNADGTVSYKTVDVSNLGNAKDLTAGDGSIVVTDGEGATLVDANVKVADGGIIEAKLANNAVTADKINTGAVTETKIGTGAVTSAKIADGTIVAEDIATKTIGADKLVADGVNDVNKVATVNADGTISYKTIDASTIGNGADLTAGDGSIVVTDGEGATLVDANVKVADGGIVEAKLANNAVTADKINTGAVTEAKIGTGAVTSAKIENGTIVSEDIATKTIGADKLVADGVNDVNKVATVNADGTVTYKTVDVSNLGNAKDLTAGDGSIVVTDGEGATLVDANVKVADGGIVEAKLANNAVTTDKINTGAVTETKIGTGAVTSAKILDGTIVADDLATGAVTSAKIDNGTIVSEDIATKTIGADKLVADGVNDVNKVATVNADGTVSYKTIDASAIGNGADLTAGDGSIVVTDGEGATLVDANVKVADGGIVEAKLANNAVTTDKINTGAVTSAKILDGTIVADDLATGAVTSAKIDNGTIVAEDIATKTIGADKLVADGVNDVNKVATVNADGTVSYKTVDVSNLGNAKDLTAGDGSIVVTDGEGATLVDANVKVADSGITEAKLANNAVTTDKINTGAVTETKIGTGAVTSAKILDGTIVADDLATGAVTSAKIDNGTIVSEDIATKTIGSDKLVADGVNDVNKVATVNADGTVSYKTVDVSNLGNAKDLTAGDGSIVVTDGEGATLVDANVKVADGGIIEAKLANNAVTADKINTGAVTETKIGTGVVTSAKIADGTIVAEDIATKTIGADKLVADGVNDVNKVATVNADGTVTYKTVDVSNLGNAKDLTAGDGSIVVTDGEGATLVDANVKVADGGITEAKLANNAVTTDKINTGAVTEAKIGTGAVTETKIGTGAVTSAKILDGTIVADDLATGAVTSAKIDNGTIVAEDIATKTIGADKLVADGVNDVNKVATVNADGTVSYKTVDVSNLGNAKDLTAGDGSIVVTDGEGATLVDANVKVADGGITEAKLANNAVTTAKIASTGDDKVLTTSATGAVEWIDKSNLAIEPWNVEGTSDKATSNGSNIYQSGSIGIGNFSGTGETVTQKLDVKDGNVRVRNINTTVGATTDRVVVADAQGVLKTVSAMPAVRTETADYDAVLVDETILADATATNVTITLPAEPVVGKKYNIKKIDTSDNSVTISGNGKTIEGLTSISGALPYQGWVLQYTGSIWYIVSRI